MAGPAPATGFGSFTGAAPPASRWGTASASVPRLPLSTLRPASTLSQDSLLDSPLPGCRAAASPTCSSRGTLSALSSYLPSPSAPAPACLTGANKAAPSKPLLGMRTGGGGSLLADILNLKRGLEGSPGGSARAAGRGEAAGGSSAGGGSMQSLDASLQRLAALTGGLAAGRKY